MGWTTDKCVSKKRKRDVGRVVDDDSLCDAR